MSEKRSLKRRHLIFYLRVLSAETGRVLGYLVDVTTRGLMLMSDAPIETGRTFRLKLLVSDEQDRERYLEFEAVSKWCRASVRSRFYDTGFQFTGLSRFSARAISQVIEELGFND